MGHAEVRPTVAAGAGDDGLYAARGERFGGDVVGAGAVENDHGFEFGFIGVDQSAHAAEIAFAFFADVGDEENAAARVDLGFLTGARDGDEGGEAGAVVGDAGAEEASAFVANFYVGGRGEDGVEMGGEDDDFFFVGAAEFADYVAGFVDLHFEAGGGEESFYRGGALGFLEWRGGDFG